MIFNLTPDEAQAAAIAVSANYGTDYVVEFEQPAWPDAPLVTTLVARQGDLSVLVEAQHTLDYHDALRNLVSWLAVHRHYALLYIATYDTSTIGAGVLQRMKKEGVGLLTVSGDENVSETLRPRNYALVVNPDPTLRYGECRAEVKSALDKFNEVNRKDGLRDMCEMVERETEKLAVAIARKGKFCTLSEVSIKNNGFDWSKQIDSLAAPSAYVSGSSPAIDANLRNDLHSFRGARNLFGHKVLGNKAEMKRQRQFAERMMMGSRLIAELVSLRRRYR